MEATKAFLVVKAAIEVLQALVELRPVLDIAFKLGLAAGLAAVLLPETVILPG
jgi:hypothetical protein